MEIKFSFLFKKVHNIYYINLLLHSSYSFFAHLSWSEPLCIFNSLGLCPADMFLLYYASCLFFLSSPTPVLPFLLPRLPSTLYHGLASASAQTDLLLSFQLGLENLADEHVLHGGMSCELSSFLTGLPRGQNVLKRVASQVCFVPYLAFD